MAIEVRPRERLFRVSLVGWLLGLGSKQTIVFLHISSIKAYRTPPAKWSAIIVWLPSGTVGVFILKMDRQVMDSREFSTSQTLEAVDFVKSHPFINAKWTMCSGPRYAFSTNCFYN